MLIPGHPFGYQGRAIFSGAGAASTTTWNPSDKDSTITLSGGNLTASTAASNDYAAVRSVASHVTSGKYYAEFASTGTGADNPFIKGIGFATAAQSLTIEGYVNDAIFCNQIGEVKTNSSTVATVEVWYATDTTLCVAVDIANQKIWFRVAGGNWNNDASANPATNTNGISFSTMNAGPYYAYAAVNTAPTTFTANFGGSAYAYSVPSGFGNW